MTQSGKHWCAQLGLASVLAMGGAIAASSQCALAQNVTLDGSLGTAQTLTNRDSDQSPYEGQSVLLLGGNVCLDGTLLQSPGGRVELGGVAGAGTVAWGLFLAMKSRSLSRSATALSEKWSFMP